LPRCAKADPNQHTRESAGLCNSLAAFCQNSLSARANFAFERVRAPCASSGLAGKRQRSSDTRAARLRDRSTRLRGSRAVEQANLLNDSSKKDSRPGSERASWRRMVSLPGTLAQDAGTLAGRRKAPWNPQGTTCKVPQPTGRLRPKGKIGVARSARLASLTATDTCSSRRGCAAIAPIRAAMRCNSAVVFRAGLGSLRPAAAKTV